MKLGYSIAVSLILVLKLTDTYAMMNDNFRDQQLSLPIHQRKINSSNPLPFVQLSLVSDDEFAQRVSDHIRFKAQIDLGGGEIINVFCWNTWCPGSPSGFDKFASSWQIRNNHSRIPEVTNRVAAMPTQPKTIIMLQEVDTSTYNGLLGRLHGISHTINGDFQTCNASFGVATFWDSNEFSVNTVKQTRSLRHQFTSILSQKDFYAWNVHCDYNIWGPTPLQNAAIIQQTLSTAPANSLKFIFGDFNHNLMNLSTYLPSNSIYAIENGSLAFTTQQNHNIFGFVTNTTDGLVVEFPNPAHHMVAPMIASSSSSSSSSSATSAPTPQPLPQTGNSSYDLSQSLLTEVLFQLKNLPPVTIPEEKINFELKPSGLSQSFSKAPDGKITVTTDDNTLASYQLESNSFPVEKDDIILVPYKINVQDRGRMSLGLLNSQRNGWLEEELILADGTYEGTYTVTVPAKETKTSLVFRNYHLANSGQTTFTIENLDILCKKALKLKPTGLSSQVTTDADGKITVITDHNTNASYQLESDRFPVTAGNKLSVPYTITVMPGGKMSLGFLSTQRNGWYDAELILEEGKHSNIYERIVPAGETETSLVFRNYHLNTPGQSTFMIEKFNVYKQ